MRCICSSNGRARISVLGECKMKLTIIILLIFCSLICYSACAVSENKTERIKDDEAQWEWIKEYNKSQATIL